jgi:hypothetical protein
MMPVEVKKSQYISDARYGKEFEVWIPRQPAESSVFRKRSL